MTMMTISTSKITRDFLATKAKGFTFTVKDLIPSLGGPDVHASPGGISGFCHRAAKMGALNVTRVPHSRDLAYVLIDPNLLMSMTIKAHRGIGSMVGRQDGRHRTLKPTPTKQSISEALLTLAAELEHIGTDLSTVPTEALLAELVRRNKDRT